MRPCVGLAGLCGAFCTWRELEDGTYNLADVLRFNYALDEMSYYRDMAGED